MPIIRPATPADALAIAQVQVATWHTAYSGVLSDDVLNTLSVEQNAANWARGIGREGRVCCVAVVDEGVVGFAYGARCRDEALEAQGYDGEIYALYVLAAQQGKGLGRQLVAASAKDLRTLGYAGMAIWVLKENASGRGFYEKLGGTLIREKTIDVRGENHIEVAYGWADLSLFST